MVEPPRGIIQNNRLLLRIAQLGNAAVDTFC